MLNRGKAEGVFRPGADPVDIHLMISSFCFFRISNRYTFNALFGRDLPDLALRATHKKMLTDAVTNLLSPAGRPEARGIDSPMV
jgi:hypothetical protein